MPLSFQHSNRQSWIFVGIFIICLAGLLALSAILVMRLQGTPVYFKKATTEIVSKGPFRYSRNPLYISLLMLYGGIGVLADSLWFALFLPVLFYFLHRVILREEKYLAQLFGSKYSAYQKMVGRWLIIW